jgi:hypothetical protein
VAINYNDWIDCGYIFRYHDGAYSSNLKDESVFDYFDDDAVVNDCIYFNGGNSPARRGKFKDLKVYVSTPFSASGVVFKWEYYNGSAWVDLSNVVDGTNGWTNTGEQTIKFDVPEDWTWVDVNGQKRTGWVRCRISSISGVSEGGANSNQKVQCGNNTIVITGYSESTPCRLVDIYEEDVSNGWGVLKTTDTDNKWGFLSLASITIGDGSMASYFAMRDKESLMFVHADFKSQANSFVTFGRLTANGTGYDGIMISFRYAVFDDGHFYMHGSMKIYGSLIMPNPNGHISPQFYRDVEMYDSVFDVGFGLGWSSTEYDLKIRNCIFKSGISLRAPHVLDIDGAKMPDGTLNLWMDGQIASGITANEIRFSSVWRPENESPNNVYAINGVANSWNVSHILESGSTNKQSILNRQYYYDLLVQDVNGDPIESASVVCKDKNGDEVFSVNTDENGEIERQTITYKIYEKHDIDGVQQDQTEEIYSPHKITITKDGYITKEFVLTFDQGRDEVETLELYVPPEAPAGINVDVEVQSDIELALSSESPPTQNWYNPNWKYRKKITIGSEVGAGEGYQKLIKVGENEGASGCDFHLDNKSDKFPSYDNSGDLRFTKDDGRTLLDCWIEKVEGDSPNRIAYVYVKIEDNLDEDVDIYCYYGNAEAENISDIDSVMTAGLRYLYFGDTSLSNLLGNDVDVDINHKWNSNVVQINGNDWESRADNVSIRWIGWVKPKTLGDCVFYSTSDDGQRLWVNEESVINDWNYHGDVEKSGNYNMDKIYPIRYEFFEATGGATAKLGWQPFGDSKVYPILSDYLRCRKYLESEPDIDGVSDEEEYSAGSNNCNVGVSVDNPSVGVQVSDDPNISVQVENNNILVEKE